MTALEYLLEREIPRDKNVELVQVLRDLTKSVGFKILKREMETYAEVQRNLLIEANPDKPGLVGRHQGGIAAFLQCADLAENLIDELNERRKAEDEAADHTLAYDGQTSVIVEGKQPTTEDEPEITGTASESAGEFTQLANRFTPVRRPRSA